MVHCPKGRGKKEAERESATPRAHSNTKITKMLQGIPTMSPHIANAVEEAITTRPNATTKTKLAPLNIGIRDNQLLVDKNGDKFVDLLSDLGWDYQCMTSSGRETYDKLMQMLGIIKPDEVYMEI